MSAPPSAPTPPSSRPRPALWVALILLVASVCINYIDRGNLSVAAPRIKVELGLSDRQLGLLLSSFFWTYATFQFVSGWLVDHYDPNWVLAIGLCAWSLATAATGLIGGFASLLALRMLVGIGESVAYPSYSKIFALHYEEGQRGMANSLIDAGCKLGPAIGTLIGGLFIARFGWRPFFFALGLGALLWLPLWTKWMPRGPGRSGAASGPVPSVREILKHRSAWGTFAGLFCSNYYWYFLLTWLPSYLVQERHFSMAKMAVFGSLPFFVTAATTTVAGWVSLRALRAGASTTTVRKTCTAMIGVAGIILLPVPVLASSEAAIACLLLGAVFYGIYTTSHWAITQTIAGPGAAGRWTGIQNGIGNFAGVAAPAVTGFVVEATGRFFWAFAVTGLISVIGGLVYVFGIGPIEPAAWAEAEARESARR